MALVVPLRVVQTVEAFRFAAPEGPGRHTAPGLAASGALRTHSALLGAFNSSSQGTAEEQGGKEWAQSDHTSTTDGNAWFHGGPDTGVDERVLFADTGQVRNQ